MFGAGASIPSGAPSGPQLARIVARVLSPEPDGTDLAEISQIVENRKGRKALITAVRSALSALTPTAGLLALPEFDWLSLYTTNFDTLVEQAYRLKGRSLDVYRSNFDVANPRTNRTPLYKIHGCITQDGADGHQSRMLITESDYDDYAKYRQTLFNSLTTDMFTADTVIVGQSLADRHLKDLARRVVDLRSQGVSTRIFLLIHEFSADRAELYSRLGIEVVHATLEAFLLALVNAGKTAGSPSYSTSSVASFLTPELVLTTTDVAHASGLQGNATRLFNGSPATYADVRQGLTISRNAQRQLDDAQRGVRGFFLVLEGARGVGKTTLARSFMLSLADRGISAWEHNPDYQLDVDAWIAAEQRLRLANKEGILLIDDCSRQMRAVNALVDRLSSVDRPHLRLVLTVDASKWKVATKSQGFFSRGTSRRLSRLERSDLEELVALVDRRPEIRLLVEQSFLALGRAERIARLRDKCSAEMFVCMKNIFANDNLDDILLQEFFSLDDDAREVYRYVAAIQSLGGYVHRQLIMRILGLDATALDSLLGRMEGIVFERTIDSRQGIFGWETRHDVIASIISRLKFADQNELHDLLVSLIDGLNPSVPIELETAVAIATEEGGIRRMVDKDDQVTLFRRLIDVIPAHRTPRRRLVKLFISEDRLSDASQEILSFDRTLGDDVVIARYRAQVSLRKAETMTSIEEIDRKAMLLDAEAIIRRSISSHGPDLHSVSTLGQIGLVLASRFGEFNAVDDSVDLLSQLEATNGDPQIARTRRQIEDRIRFVTGDSDRDILVTDITETSDPDADSA